MEQTLLHQLIKNGTNVTNLTAEDDIIGDSEQIPTDKYASQWSSQPEARSFTGEHICQLDLRGIADYRSLSVRFATLDNLRCWRDNHLHTIE